MAENTSPSYTDGATERLSSVSTDSSTCSVQELVNLTDQCRATGRLRRESRSQSAEGSGQTSLRVLTHNLSSRLNNLDLIPKEQERSSVIIQTPRRIPKASTPRNSPEAPLLSPRNCQSLDPIILPRSRSHFPTCSEVSSINGEVFSDVENQITDQSKVTPKVPLSRAVQAIGTLDRAPVIYVTGTMEAAEKEVTEKSRKLCIKMRIYQLDDLDEGSFDEHLPKMNAMEELLDDLLLSIERICDEQW